MDKTAAVFKHFFLLLEPFRQKINLKMETPPFKIAIKFFQIRIGVDFFKGRPEMERLRERTR